jgi:hypothetical protein
MGRQDRNALSEVPRAVTDVLARGEAICRHLTVSVPRMGRRHQC